MTVRIHKPMHKLINKNGAVLSLPANIVGGRFNLSDPDIYAQSSDQLFPLGAKLEFTDGSSRVFRYGKIGATSTSPPIARMVVNANACPGATGEEDTDGYEGDLYAAAVADQEYVDLEVATAYAENFFEDGQLSVFPSGHYTAYRICGSELGNGTYCRCYLDAPLKTALSGTDGVTAYKSIYSQLKVGGAEGVGYVSAVGLYLGATFTADYFCWVQTWGLCIITPTAYFGDSANERLAMFWQDGTIATAATADPSSGHQIIGYLTQRTVSGYGDLQVMLQLGR